MTLYWDANLRPDPVPRRLLDFSLPLLRNPAIIGWGGFLEHAFRESLWGLTSRKSIGDPEASSDALHSAISSDLFWITHIWARVLRLKWYLGEGPWTEMIIPTDCEYPRRHDISLDEVLPRAGSLEYLAEIPDVVNFRGLPLFARLDAIKKRIEGRLVVLATASDGRGDELLKPEPCVPLDLGPVTKEQGNESGWDVGKWEDGERRDPWWQAWLEDYAKETVGLTEDEIRVKHASNFPPHGSVHSLDELIGRDAIAYVRRKDFPTEHDWASFLLNELFEQQYGFEALYSELNSYLAKKKEDLIRSLSGKPPNPATCRDSAENQGDLAGTQPSKSSGLALCRELADKIEYGLQEVAVGVMKWNYQDPANLDKWVEALPKKVKDDVLLLWGESTADAKESFFNIMHYKLIFEKHWRLFGEFFAGEGKGSPSYGQAVGWIDKFNHVRNKLNHPSRHPRSLREGKPKQEELPLVELEEWIKIVDRAVARMRKKYTPE